MIIITVAAGRQSRHDSGIPPDLEAALGQVLAGRSCLTATEAERLIGVRLERSEYSDWSISRGGGIRPNSCVSAGVSTSDHRIVLVPVAPLEVRQAMRSVREELYRRCLGKDEAARFIVSVLRGVGETDPEIRADGPIVLPEASGEAVQRHVDNGCFIYSGMTWTANGEPVYMIAGPSAAQRTERPTISGGRPQQGLGTSR
jgi:hypothetical protein